ncbi:hypothetical protein ACHQM5_018426 [Ranunculus cassubicifolius]
MAPPPLRRRTTHLTQLGSISCQEVIKEEFRSSSSPYWLSDDNPNIFTALHTHSIALANRSIILIIHWNHPPNPSPIKIKPSSIEGEITAIEWFVFDDDDHVRAAICVATSNGYLLLYSLHGHLIHKQIVHPGRILRLHVRGSKSSSRHDGLSSEDVCVVMPGVIARFDGADLRSLLQRWFQESHSQFWGQKPKNGESDGLQNSFGRLPYQLWNVSKYGLCSDAAITGIIPPPLLELQSSERYYCAVTIGVDAVISAYRLSADRKRSIVGAILSKVVPAAFSTLSSVSRMIWRSQTPPPKKEEVKTQPFAKASSLTCLKDHNRKGEKLTLSPGGTLAAITDSLGRILLLDTEALVVLRIWKGYRDAHCLFMEMIVGKESVSSTSSHREQSKSDFCLCLAIHAPRKEIVEVWQMRYGPCLMAIRCPKGSKILQPTPRFGSSEMNHAMYLPLEVFMLNGDSGQISVINRSIH